MKHLLKFQDAHAPRLFFGLEEDIRLAVLKDEVDLWQKRVGDDLDSIPYSVIIRNTLKSRIKELEKSAILIKER
jgi:hypothetical protein